MLKDEEKGGFKNVLSAPFKEKALQNATLVRFGATAYATDAFFYWVVV